MLSNKVYDVLKIMAQYVLPGVATLYLGLAKIWGLPYSEQIVGTILAVDIFLGAILGISTMQYNKQVPQLARVDKYVQSAMIEMDETIELKTVFSISNTTYDALYWIAQILLPALGGLYFALSTLWNFPYGEQVVGTIALVDTVLGIFLGISSNQYKKKY